MAAPTATESKPAVNIFAKKRLIDEIATKAVDSNPPPQDVEMVELPEQPSEVKPD